MCGNLNNRVGFPTKTRAAFGCLPRQRWKLAFPISFNVVANRVPPLVPRVQHVIDSIRKTRTAPSLSQLAGASWQGMSNKRIHTGRAAGCDRHHWNSDWNVASGGPVGSCRRETFGLPEQLASDWIGAAELRIGQTKISSGSIVHQDSRRRRRPNRIQLVRSDSSSVGSEQQPTDGNNRNAIAQTISFALCPSTALIDGDRDSNGMITQFVTDTVTDPFDMGCLDYMGIVGPKDGDNDILDPSGNEYERNQGMLLKLKKRDDEHVGLVSPGVKIGEIIDGTSNTMFVTECTGRGADGDTPDGAWVCAKNNAEIDRGVKRKKSKKSQEDELIYSDHYGGANTLFVDGSVRFQSDSIEDQVVWFLSSRSGGEVTSQQ